VKFGNRVLLLGQSASQINILADTSSPEEIKQLEPEPAPEGAESGTISRLFAGSAWAGKPRSAALWIVPLALGLMLAASAAQAQQFPNIAGINFEAARSPQQAVGSVQILILMSVLAFVPALILMVTSFTRIIIVLSLLRQAIGLPQIPPNQVIVALSLFLTLFVMRPQLAAINEAALDPYLKGRISHTEAFKRAEPPLRAFMMAQTRRQDPPHSTHSVFRDQRAQDGFPDRILAFYPFPAYRHDSGVHPYVYGHGDDTTGHDIYAV
jgi:hypothetical protein